MTDLFVYVADADAQAVMRAVLSRHQSLGIRPVSFEVDRHPMRDGGMIKDGPETIRFKVQKADYDRLLLLWDHDGSGVRRSPDESVEAIRQRLENASWRHRCAAVAIVPELEEWLWHNPASVAKVLGCSDADLDPSHRPLLGRPKERFEWVVRKFQRRQPMPRDFEKIASAASLKQWEKSETFRRVADTLREWFPPLR